MMAMTVFSRKPARTSFTTDALVKGSTLWPPPACASARTPPNTNATAASTRLIKQVFNINTPQSLNRRNPSEIPESGRQ
jgi:hypothetical protein